MLPLSCHPLPDRLLNHLLITVTPSRPGEPRDTPSACEQ